MAKVRSNGANLMKFWWEKPERGSLNNNKHFYGNLRGIP